MCTKCRHIHGGDEDSNIEIPSKCESCGQSDIDMFIRLDKEDFDHGDLQKIPTIGRTDYIPPQVESITIGVGRRCPTCGEFPEDFRQSFTRRVDENFIIPEKSRTYSESGGKVFCIEDHNAKRKAMDPDFEVPEPEPEGLYTSVIVPNHLIGKVIRIKVEEVDD